MEWWQGFTVEVNFLPTRTPGMPPHPAEVLSSAGTSTWVPLLGKLLSSALWELRADPFLNEGWEWRCVNSTCQGKPLTRPEWVSKRNFQALNSFPALTRALFISAPPLYSFCHLTQSFHWLLCGCLEGWSLCGGEEFRDFVCLFVALKKKSPEGLVLLVPLVTEVALQGSAVLKELWPKAWDWVTECIRVSLSCILPAFYLHFATQWGLFLLPAIQSQDPSFCVSLSVHRP